MFEGATGLIMLLVLIFMIWAENYGSGEKPKKKTKTKPQTFTVNGRSYIKPRR